MPSTSLNYTSELIYRQVDSLEVGRRSGMVAKLDGINPYFGIVWIQMGKAMIAGQMLFYYLRRKDCYIANRLGYRAAPKINHLTDLISCER